MEKVVYYARVSTQEQEQLNALQDQITELESFIAQNSNWELVEKYIDEGKSGTSTKNRNAYNKLIGDLSTNKFDIIVIKDETRLNRNVLEWYKFIDSLLKNGKKLYFYMERKFYNSEDGFLVGIKALMAQQYSKDLSVKINNAHRQRQKKGKICTNNRILGYDLVDGKLIINKEQANIVRSIYDMYINGNGFFKIAQVLKEEGIKNTIGKSYNQTSLKRIVTNEKYKGTLIGNKRHKDFETKKIYNVPKEKWIIRENVLPPIVSKEIWEKANNILSKRKQEYIDARGQTRKTGYKQNTFVYTSKIICGECGKAYWHENNVWRCSTCRRKGNRLDGLQCSNKHPIKTILLNNIIKDLINKFWNDKEYNIDRVINSLEKVINETEDIKSIDEMTKKRDKIIKQKNTLIDYLTSGIISKEDFIVKKQEYEQKIHYIEEDIKRLTTSNNHLLNKKEKLLQIKDFLLEEKDKELIIDEETINFYLNKIIVNKNNTMEVYFNNIEIKYIIRFNKEKYELIDSCPYNSIQKNVD